MRIGIVALLAVERNNIGATNLGSDFVLPNGQLDPYRGVGGYLYRPAHRTVEVYP